MRFKRGVRRSTGTTLKKPVKKVSHWSPAQVRTRVRSALRALWTIAPIRKERINKDKTRRGFFICCQCKEECPTYRTHEFKNGRTARRSNQHVDHIEPICLPERNIDDWGEWVKRAFLADMSYEEAMNRLRSLCHDCHEEITAKETTERAAYRKLNKTKGNK